MTAEDLKGKVVLVTGAAGFLGHHLVAKLNECGATVLKTHRGPGYRSDYCHVDLRSTVRVDNLFYNLTEDDQKIDYVFHLAGFNGGIAFNQTSPADIFIQNTQMGMNVLDACRRHKVKKVVSVVASCAYPHLEWESHEYTDSCRSAVREVMKEDGFLDGPPHDSVACHGYAKRNIQLASDYLNKQYGLNAVCVCPTTLYGPSDSFDPNRTKVVGGMVRRFVDAKRNGDSAVVCWGSGKPMREYLYVKDCAQLLIQSLLHFNDSGMPLNLGTGQEYSIKETAEKVAQAAGYKGRIFWDDTKPDGQFRKRLDLEMMREALPVFVPTSFEDGLVETVKYYSNLKEARGEARHLCR